MRRSKQIENIQHDKIDKEKFFYILNGKNRVKIYYTLLNCIKSARDIEKSTGISLSSICRSLKELKEKGIIECLNENFAGTKLYTLHPDVTNMKRYLEIKINLN